MSEDKEVPQKDKEVPQMGLNDIRACVSIIDICTKRGAFNGEELADVGTLRNKLAEFVNANIQSDEVEDAGE